MYKVLIADDESIILNGILESVDWAKMGMQVVATANNGKQALKLIDEHKPDLCLLDVRMPFVNGLDVAGEYLAEKPDGVVILITGYDEFSYAQKAIRTGVMAYILKPVDENELIETVNKAAKLIDSRRKSKELIINNKETLRDAFLQNWLMDNLTDTEVRDNLEFHDMALSEGCAMIYVNFYCNNVELLQNENFDKKISSARQNMEELLKSHSPGFVLCCRDSDFVAMHGIDEAGDWLNLPSLISEMLLHDGINSEILHSPLERIEDIPKTYKQMKAQLAKLDRLTPIVRLLKQFIDQNYRQQDLSLSSFSQEHRTTSSYLSRQFKLELGRSYTDYLAAVRINKALKYLQKTHIKMYEIAQNTGYNSQHYFCESFKKIIGITPSEYRQQSVIDINLE